MCKTCQLYHDKWIMFGWNINDLRTVKWLQWEERCNEKQLYASTQDIQMFLFYVLYHRWPHWAVCRTVGSGARKHGTYPLTACLHHTLFFPLFVWMIGSWIIYLRLVCLSPISCFLFESLCLSWLPICLNYRSIVRFSALPASWTCTLDLFA